MKSTIYFCQNYHCKKRFPNTHEWKRWRTAKAVGIKEVPVERKDHVTPAERLLYQLQSEGAELDFIERNKAWARLWELSKGFETKRGLSEKLGVNETTFSNIIQGYKEYQSVLNVLKKKSPPQGLSYDTLIEVASEDKQVIQKAVKEKWTRDKSEEIRKALKERPLRSKLLMDQQLIFLYNYLGGNKQKQEVVSCYPPPE